MARIKEEEEEEETNPQGYRQFVEPPLIPGKPAFYRWIGYFDFDPGDVVEVVKRARDIVDPDSLRGLPDFDPEVIIAGIRRKER
jgi:hypothetical protein